MHKDKEERPKFGTEESKITETTEWLKNFGLQIDKIKKGLEGTDVLDQIINTIERCIHDGKLNLFDQLLSFYLLGQAYNTKKMMSTDPCSAQFNNIQIWKEVYCYRKVALIFIMSIERSTFS